MSRSIFACRHCGRPLGYHHHSGRLHAAPGVTVYLDPRARDGPLARLVCPVYDKARDYRDGAVVVRPGEEGTNRAPS